jgi:hypothetical protein
MVADFSFDPSLSACGKAPGWGHEKPTRLTQRINQKCKNQKQQLEQKNQLHYKDVIVHM